MYCLKKSWTYLKLSISLMVIFSLNLPILPNQIPIKFSSQASSNTASKNNTDIDKTIYFEAINNTQFVAKTKAYHAEIAANKITLSLNNQENPNKPIQINFINSNAQSELVAENPLLGKSNYFIGNDEKNWQTQVKHYKQVQAKSVYPGIDLNYYGNNGQLEYDFLVSPKTNPQQIKLSYSGMEKLALADNGDLVLTVANETIRQHKPIVYQVINNSKQFVDCNYLITDNTVSFNLANYDPNHTLVIDPVISYATYIGGDGQDAISLNFTDSAGNFYLVGNSRSSNFPLVNPVQNRFKGSGELIVVKLNPNGQILYSTYVGGKNEERPLRMVVDNSGNIYVIGATNSRDLPLKNALQDVYTKTRLETFFVIKLDANGGLVYSTYLGGGGEVLDPFRFVVDDNGNFIMLGTTNFREFKLLNAFQTLYGNRDGVATNVSDLFLTKLNSNGGAIFSTYLGGIGNEEIAGLSLDPLGNIYVAGTTESKTFPKRNAIQKKFAGGTDGFVTKFSPRGEVIYSTFLGGSGFDDIRNFVVDTIGNITLTGKTGSPNFPIQNAFQSVLGGNDDVFITKLSDQGAIIFSTYFGGNDRELTSNLDLKVTLDNANNLLLSGTTFSSNFPMVGNSFQSTYGQAGDIFLAKISMLGQPIFTTYLGGQRVETVLRIISDANGNIYLLGESNSPNFPLRNAFQSVQRGDKTLVVAKFATDGSLVYSTYLGGQLMQEVGNFTADSLGNTYVMGRTKSIDFPTRNAFQPMSGGGFGAFFDVFVTKFGASGDVIYSTYLGGSQDENNQSLGFSFVDPSGQVYLVGTTSSTDFPTRNALQTSLSGATDIYITSFDPQGRAISSSYFGGNGMDRETNVVITNTGIIYLTGVTESTNFPTLNGAQSSFGGGGQDGFFAVINP